ncbi:hypothetical protein B566_EDAN000723 [Ephemera danica]|nr:hypothetical protein B566_EDAN000723 [Ephemera danica]
MPPAKMDNPLFGGGGGARHTLAASDIPALYTATVKRSLHGAGVGGPSNLMGPRNSQVAPAPPKVSWPRGSIPRRVKKLSWDDETNSGSVSESPGDRRRTELDPDVSVTPLSSHNEPNLTVYF